MRQHGSSHERSAACGKIGEFERKLEKDRFEIVLVGPRRRTRFGMYHWILW